MGSLRSDDRKVRFVQPTSVIYMLPSHGSTALHCCTPPMFNGIWPDGSTRPTTIALVAEIAFTDGSPFHFMAFCVGA